MVVEKKAKEAPAPFNARAETVAEEADVSQGILTRCLNAAPSVRKLTIFNVIFSTGRSARLSGRWRHIHRKTTTSVPTLTRSYRSIMSWLYMRKHPCETNPPIDFGLLVPWIAY